MENLHNQHIIQKFPLSHSAYQKMNTCGLSYDLYYNKRLENQYTASTMLSGRVFDEVFNAYLHAMWKQNNIDLKAVFEEKWHKEFLSVERESNQDEKAIYETLKYISMLIPASVNASGIVPYSTIDGEPCIQHSHVFDVGYGVKVRTIIDLIGFSKHLKKPVIIDVKATKVMADTDFVSISEQLLIYSLSAENDPRLEDTSFDLGAYWQGERKTMPTLKKDLTLRKGSSYPKIILPEIEKFNSFHKQQMPQRYIQTQLDINQKRFFGGSRMAYNSPCKLCDYSQLCIRGDGTGLVKRDKYRRKTA
jgi:hypothetical protein